MWGRASPEGWANTELFCSVICRGAMSPSVLCSSSYQRGCHGRGHEPRGAV